MGDADLVIREPNDLWIDPMGSGQVVPDLAWKRDGATCALDVHTHAASVASARTLPSRIATADAKKRNGAGTIDALTAARAAAEAATKAAEAAEAAGAPNSRQLAAFAL